MDRRTRDLLVGLGLVLAFALMLILSRLERRTIPKPNHDQVAPGIHMGGFVSTPPPGVQAVLNLCEVADPYACEVHAWEPIVDSGPAPSLDWLQARVQWIAEQRNRGRVVFVHCKHGVSRSGLVVAAYLMFERGWSVEQSLDFIRQTRPEVNPNPAFRALLRDWEKTIPNPPGT